MNRRRIAVVLAVLATSLWVNVRSAHAFCQSNDDCIAPKECIDARCQVPPPDSPSCIPSGSIDDTLYSTNCCSGRAVPGSTYCINPADWYTTWASCSQICA
jgi:hypothetical protein